MYTGFKQIIGGKLYNTKTSNLLGEYWNGLSKGDYNYLYEELYRTKNGVYFIFTDDGEEKISPISEEKAKEWMEEHCSADKYIAAFGEPEEA